MKLCLFITAFIFCALPICFGQSFEGVWKGKFQTEAYLYGSNYAPINLYFQWNKDSSYTVYSFCKGYDDVKDRDTTIVCSVNYTFVGTDSVYLEETAVLKPKTATSSCLQKMKFRIKETEKETTLTGTWESAGDCGQGGKMSFWRKKGKRN